MHSFSSIPFKTHKYHGLAEVNGVAKFSSAGIVLEFDSKILGLVSVGVEEARLPIGEILDIKFKKGVFRHGSKIEIRTRSLAAKEGLPSEDGKLALKLKTDDFERGRDAVAQLQRDLTAMLADLPPAHTPVSVLFDESEDETQRLPADLDEK